MSAHDVAIIAGLILAWCLVGARAQRAGLSGPMVFLAAGALLAQTDVVDISVDSSVLQVIVELTLVLALFSDASEADLSVLGHHGGWAARMLVLGLPLSIVAGTCLAMGMFPVLGWSTALLLGASLAATDASLSAGVLADERVPKRIRLALNLESGLNDGLATPVVLFAITAAAGALGVDHVSDEASLLVELAGGALLGIAIGGAGGWLIERAYQRGWMEPGARRLATLAIPVGTMAAAEVTGASMFIAAFVAGLAFGQVPHQPDDELDELPVFAAEALAWVTWFLFGASLLIPALERVDWRIAIYVGLSLTVVRMVPIAVSLLGSRADRPTRLFLGWFGPRGLATVVFGLLILEDLGNADPAVQVVIATMAAAIVTSIVAHAVTASPLAAWIQRSSQA